MAEDHRFVITLEHLRELEFKVSFDWENTSDLLMDEAPPVGDMQGPNASRLVAAAVGNCLTASLLFCLQRSKVDISGARTEVECTLERNERKRLRIGQLKASIRLPLDGVEKERLERCLGLFEDYCVVTESIRHGVPVAVEVTDENGTVLRSTAGG